MDAANILCSKWAKEGKYLPFYSFVTTRLMTALHSKAREDYLLELYSDNELMRIFNEFSTAMLSYSGGTMA